MSSKQKVNGRNYGARGGQAKAPEAKPLSENVIVSRETITKLLKENEKLADEVVFLTAKLKQAEEVNQTLKKMIVSYRVIG